MPHSDKQEEWEKKWSDPAYTPKWRASAIPVELQRAIQRNWFAAGDTLLDIGCGSGEIAAWLASKGLKVTGIDFAQAAIDLCSAAYGGKPGLHFQTMDMTRPINDIGPFDALFDRGCFHTLGGQSVPGYVENVSRLCKQGGHFAVVDQEPTSERPVH